MDSIKELTPDLLRRTCTDEEIAVIETGDVPPADVLSSDLFIGLDQRRLLDSLLLGINQQSKQHVYVAGLYGPQALLAIKDYVERTVRRLGSRHNPSDWCYRYNFDDPTMPIPSKYSKGVGAKLKDRLSRLLMVLREAIPESLNHEDVMNQRQAVNTRFQQWVESTRIDTVNDALKDDMVVQMAEETFVMPISRRPQRRKPEIVGQRAPQHQEPPQPEPMSPEELRLLSLETQAELNAKIQKWLTIVGQRFVELQQKNAKLQQDIMNINLQCVSVVVNEAFKNAKLEESPFVLQLKKYTIDNYAIFVSGQASNQQSPGNNNADPSLPWRLNLFVDNSATDGPPVIVDMDASYQSLVGRIERSAGAHGFIYTDHMMISAGSLARANDGFLILDLNSLAQNPGAYKVIKKAIANEYFQIEDPMSFLGYGSSVPLQPLPIPLNIKVILVGSRYYWNLLTQYDEEFLDRFSIKADVSPMVEWKTEETRAMAAWMRTYAKKEELLPPDSGAIKKLIEYSARLTDSRNNLSTSNNDVEMALREASLIADAEQSAEVTAGHIRKAREAKFYRSSLGYEYMQKRITDKQLLIKLTGEEVGEINILSVTSLGDMTVGFPGRLTARWSLGQQGFMNIHKEAKLTGSSTEKADLTVQGLIRSMFIKKYPLALNVTYTFEQTYGMIDGDSASLALFYALLSALAEKPITQGIGITSSLSLHGEIQPIGGVNEKIEGFYLSCLAAGELTGRQGVIISTTNLDDLMLNEQVVEAVENKLFHVWAIDHVDEGIEILMGLEAGKRESDGSFTDGSLYRLVDDQLRNVAMDARNFFAANNQGSASVS